ncbi:MAG: cofactor-independent phosphoglycerate mutase [Prevotellaceae bacterium]|nr:cofactor-independent phosphoglycerate mutase [Prevotellaceae bacterium]MDY3856960.1 cofactor-independent phosphoglycerate mutase [Bacteroidaceae bacterium]
MKHLIILGDGMADHPVARLGGKTLLQYASTPHMDQLARLGRGGRLMTIPEGFHPGSEVANSVILGYDQHEVYEGRGPLEAASIGYDMQQDDMAMRCNLICIQDGKIKNHHGGHLTTQQGDLLIQYLEQHLGNERVKFISGIQYRHLLIIKGGNKHIVCAPPHDHPNEPWAELMVKPEEGLQDADEPGRMSAQATADLLNHLILQSQQLLAKHPFNKQRAAEGLDLANTIWPWSPGYRPHMQTLEELYPDQIKQGAVISAVDLIRGIGKYAGLRNIIVPGATGLADTNYEGKTQAALDALKTDDFVFLHIEASDEAGHDGDVQLKLRTIENLDQRVVGPIFDYISHHQEDPVCVALLPDHPTPVELRTHVAEPVPFAIWYPGIKPDDVSHFDEVSAVDGSYELLRLSEFMEKLMQIR